MWECKWIPIQAWAILHNSCNWAKNLLFVRPLPKLSRCNQIELEKQNFSDMLHFHKYTKLVITGNRILAWDSLHGLFLHHFWWLVRVTLVGDWLFLPQNFQPVSCFLSRPPREIGARQGVRQGARQGGETGSETGSETSHLVKLSLLDIFC